MNFRRSVMEKLMKKHILIFGAVVLIVGIALIGLSNGKTKTIKGSGVLSVNDIQADPSAYKGAITVNGVVAILSKQDPKVFAIIETSEAKLCKQTGCARFYLPVRYEGEIPKVWDEVNVTGSLAEKGRFFVATKVEVLRHLNF